MSGLSAKLTSLVEAADDPAAVPYAVTHLGAGVPARMVGNGTDKGFGKRVQRLREELVQKLSLSSRLHHLARLQHRQLEQIQLQVQER
jgi:hypothetical protein